MAVVIETTLGDITVDLFVEERPRACLNFIKLCKLKYYNFNLFHTIERDFIAQTGDPVGTGDGGESIWGVVEGSHKRFFEAESLPKIKHTVPGLLSLVSVGKYMVGSQFIFTLGSDLTSLDGIHCVIGEVVEGREVLRQLNEAIVDEQFRPYQDIRVTHTVILDDPFSDPRGFQVPSRSPSPSAERMQNGRIGADEDIDDTEGKTMEEIQEMLAEREAKARATILEIVGDLPDADIAPPENVLFVCKLNPVTTDDDLEIIFSRFGKVKSCEVIRDKVSGDSLQYAFVEFEEQKSCEAAYFKMDNVLIDDRRIHVDFSQSVSKVQWRGKGRGVVHADERDRKLDFNNLKDERGGNRSRGKEQRRQKDRSRSPIGARGGREYNARIRDLDNYGSYNRKSPFSRRRSTERNSVGEKWRNSRRSPDSNERHYRRRASPFTERRRSPQNVGRNSPERWRSSQSGRQRSTADDKRRSPHERQRSPLNESRSSNRRRFSGERPRSPPRGMGVNPTDSHRNPVHEPRYDRKNQLPGSKRREQSLPSPDKTSKAVSRRDGLDTHSKNRLTPKPLKKESKSKKNNEKVRKRKKRVKSSSPSSSDSETVSSSTSSSSSSSSSEEQKRKKTHKSKKKEQKNKKRPKKKSKRRDSSSSD